LQRTFLAEVDEATMAIQRTGWLSSGYSIPVAGGSTYGFGRVWVSGTCENYDGGFCKGVRNAYLMGIVP
jgi:hypothetical protein